MRRLRAGGRSATPVLLAVVLALSGCALLPEPRPTATPDVSGIDAQQLPFYAQTLEWERCDGADDGDYDCTRVTAPLDWDDPDAGEIELAVIRRLADDGDAIGSLLTNPGGPGASGYDLIAESATFAVGADVAAAYDVIGFDPRGVGRSTAVTCLDADAMDAYLFDVPDAARGSAAWEDELGARNDEFAAACDARSDGILPFIDTVSAARDLDLLRGVLGDATLSYLGYSYGTSLGATYAALFPDRVGRLVLDGALDPSISSATVGAVQAVGFESALRSFMGTCLTWQDCPFLGSVDDAMNDLSLLLRSVDERPLPASDGRSLGADTLVTAIVAALYAQSSWPVLSAALADVLAGDPDQAFALADFYYGRVDGAYLDNSTEAFTAYNCVDYPEPSAAETAAAEARITADAPTIAPYWSGVDVCASWPAAPTGQRGAVSADGAAPIVVIGTTGDPATPYEWAVSLADQLSSGVLLTFEGEGHTAYNKGSACIDEAVSAYLLRGTVPEDGLVCG